MPKAPSTKVQILQILISVAVIAASAVDIVGQRARLVNMVAIVAGGIAAGIPLGRLIERTRKKKERNTAS